MGTGETQSFQNPRYPGDWRDAVPSAPQVLWGLAGLSHFSPQVPLGLLGPSHFRLPDTLGTGGTQSFQAPSYPCWDWRDSVLSGSQIPLLGLARLSHFSPQITMGT